METEWVLARIQLYQLMQQHPDWSVRRLAQALDYSESWVKKWRKRFHSAGQKTWQMFLSQSRAPKRHGRKVAAAVVECVLALRDSLKELYHRRIGPKLILYHLHQDEQLQQQAWKLPTSDHTIWRILKEGGRIPTAVRSHEVLDRPDPLSEWELDFGITYSLVPGGVEFLVVVDRGTSLLVDTQVAARYHADTALQAVAQVLLLNGLPQRLRFDRDSRWVGSWTTDGYPSALVRFLRCLSIHSDICPPHRPDLKPFVERCIRTLKHECLFVHRPDTLPQTDLVLAEQRLFYNTDRPNQSLACHNLPPLTAFPTLPTLPSLPDWVNPDDWLDEYEGRWFRRQVSASGAVMVDKYTYYVGRKYAGQKVTLHVDVGQTCFHVQYQGKMVKRLPIKGLFHTRLPFQDYLKIMMEEARSIEQHLQRKAKAH